jgi:hypothetical protein
MGDEWVCSRCGQVNGRGGRMGSFGPGWDIDDVANRMNPNNCMRCGAPRTMSYSSPSSASSSSSCFIATAAYGSASMPEVIFLREFRDRYLRTRRSGRAFISLYELTSPPVADFIRDKPRVRSMVRKLINVVFVRVAKIL